MNITYFSIAQWSHPLKWLAKRLTLHILCAEPSSSTTSPAAPLPAFSACSAKKVNFLLMNLSTDFNAWVSKLLSPVSELKWTYDPWSESWVGWNLGLAVWFRHAGTLKDRKGSHRHTQARQSSLSRSWSHRLWRAVCSLLRLSYRHSRSHWVRLGFGPRGRSLGQVCICYACITRRHCVSSDVLSFIRRIWGCWVCDHRMIFQGWYRQS